jgi:hypothetical protein
VNPGFADWERFRPFRKASELLKRMVEVPGPMEKMRLAASVKQAIEEEIHGYYRDYAGT